MRYSFKTEFSTEESQMAERHLKNCSASLSIMEVQIKKPWDTYHLIPVRMVKIKNTDKLVWRVFWVRGTLLHCWWECKLVQPLWKSIWQFLRKLFIILPQDPAIPPLAVYTSDVHSYYKDICSTVFIAALFIITKTWKQPRYPSFKEWIK